MEVEVMEFGYLRVILKHNHCEEEIEKEFTG